ncbi:DUF6428 family protein [Pedobacter faecalis]|uniref:DUF6428 family protein n=1 Tax=Pedobacter faecalis TaxID=3041495 RepID=UPI00254E8406|nr:DUF6428 family protein [Pedobacter sp. ELA7]
MEALTWEIFKAQLRSNKELDLQFQYAEDKRADPAYHITEIKQAPITSVDCGGMMNSWTEVIVQVWESGTEHQERSMKASKALSIIDLVEKSLPLHPQAIVKIEYGNADFDTRQMLPKSVVVEGQNLVVDLRPDTVQCKATDRGGNCGPKPKIELKNLTLNAECTPASGCCS